MISVLIPAKDEEARIGATVQAALSLAHVREVIVIDDGSTDKTDKVATLAGAKVVTLPQNRGKAAALMAGGKAANGEIFLLLDADLGATAAEAHILTAPVLDAKADMTIAMFPVVPGRGGGRGIVVRASRALIQRSTGQTMQAPLSGQRCLTRAVWDAVQPLAPGFGVETGMTIDALRAGFRLLEVPTTMDHRVTQNDWRAQKHRLRQLRDVLRAALPRLMGRRR